MFFLSPPGANRWQGLVTFGLCLAAPMIVWGLFAHSLNKPLIPESGAAVRVLAVLLAKQPQGVLDLNTLLYQNPSAWSFFGIRVIAFLGEFARQIYLLHISRLMPFPQNTDFQVLSVAVVGTTIVSLLMSFTLRDKNLRKVIVIWLISAIAITIAYSFFVLADWFFQRYALPLSVTFGVLASIVILTGLARLRSRRWTIGVASGLTVAVVAAYILILTTDFHYQWIFAGSEKVPDDGYYTTAQWINTHVKPGVRVGAFQSGVIGYYATVPVINLDGKVNHDAYEALVQGNMWDYICAKQVSYVVDLPDFIQDFLILRSRNWQQQNLMPIYQSPSDLKLAMTVYEVNCPGVES